MTRTSPTIADARRDAIHGWLNDTFDFTHFITLASNSSEISTAIMRDRIKHWDALVNRELYGPKWRKHYDELIWWFAFIEKPETNPHWHLLCRFQDHEKLARFFRAAGQKWMKVLPAGTVDFQAVKEKPAQVIDYVLKRVGHEVEYSNFITPDEFRQP